MGSYHRKRFYQVDISHILVLAWPDVQDQEPANKAPSFTTRSHLAVLLPVISLNKQCPYGGKGMPKRVLLIEPYYGGSHKQFLDGMTNNITADFILWSLPARKWKMRMQLAAPWFVSKISEMSLKIDVSTRCYSQLS